MKTLIPIKKQFVLVIIFLFLATITIPNIDASRLQLSPESVLKQKFDGNILYVGGFGPGNFSHIQDAIDNASDGDTVYVYKGTYIENVYINVRIQLLGEDMNTTIIDGNYTDSVVLIDADGVTLSGFTFQNSGSISTHEDRGLKVFSDYNIIKQNRVINNPGGGIKLYYSNYNQLSDNIISFNDYGIDVFSSSYNYIHNNTFSNNGPQGIGMGGVPIPCIQNVISNNKIIYNYGGVWFGWGCIDTSVTSNEIIGISIDDTDGISSISSFVNISKNKISNTEVGIDLFDESTYCMVNDNLLEDNVIGINLYRTGFHTLRNNLLRENNYGLYVGSSFNNTITQNNFIKNQRQAFFIEKDANIPMYVNNTWDHNYWNRPRFLPKLILGKESVDDDFPNLFALDKHPALKPYTIE